MQIHTSVIFKNFHNSLKTYCSAVVHSVTDRQRDTQTDRQTDDIIMSIADHTEGKNK